MPGPINRSPPPPQTPVDAPRPSQQQRPKGDEPAKVKNSRDEFEWSPKYREYAKELLREQVYDKLRGAFLERPDVKALPTGAREALKTAMPYLTPRELIALDGQLRSDAFKKLAPDAKEQTVKSLLEELTPEQGKLFIKAARTRDWLDRFR